jgi:hypothetical protein
MPSGRNLMCEVLVIEQSSNGCGKFNFSWVCEYGHALGLHVCRTLAFRGDDRDTSLCECSEGAIVLTYSCAVWENANVAN